MANQEEALLRIQALTDKLQKARKTLQLENPQAAELDLENVKQSISSLEEVIDYDKALRDLILSLVIQSQDARYDLVQRALANGSLSEVEINQISFARKAIEQFERALLDIATTLSLQIIDQAIQDIKEPGEQILGATKKVKAAIDKLENLNRQIEVLSKIVNLFQTIITAASQGIPALIGTILEEIDKL